MTPTRKQAAEAMQIVKLWCNNTPCKNCPLYIDNDQCYQKLPAAWEIDKWVSLDIRVNNTIEVVK